MKFLKQLKQAKETSFKLLSLKTALKNQVLLDLWDLLKKNEAKILKANQEDVLHAEEKHQSRAFIERLKITPDSFTALLESLKNIISFPDPVGEKFDEKIPKNGLKLYKMRVPIGVILIIYEARPNVTIEAFALCFKSGNVCLLKGGSFSKQTNLALAEVILEALKKNSLSEDYCQYFDLNKQEDLIKLLIQEEFIDLIIPRGGESLIKTVVEHSRIPIIKHYKGINHIYIDKEADLKKSLKVCLNAKVNRPATCNALGFLLVHRDISRKFLPTMISEYEKFMVKIRACEKTRQIFSFLKQATSADWETEFLDLIIGIKIVENIDEAIHFINAYGSQHTEAIMTENPKTAERFINEVDASAVFVNASTRLHDGGEFGLGAEIGISTEKIHARGPMGLQELTIYKWVGEGNGQIRE